MNIPQPWYVCGHCRTVLHAGGAKDRRIYIACLPCHERVALGYADDADTADCSAAWAREEAL